MINRLCIIGIGLIGGSLARAAKQYGVCNEIIGVGRSLFQLKHALELGVIDRGECDLAGSVRDADVVVLAVPLGVMKEILCDIVPYLKCDAVVTDVGSAKGSVIAAVQAAYGKTLPARFVPGHPIAGIEKSGMEHSFAELFHGRHVILTPMPYTSRDAVDLVRGLWEAVGAEVLEMDVVRHDEILAAVSHLPHLLAYILVDSLARMQEHADIFRYAANGFRDFTRIASSDPVIWRDICLANGKAILAILERYSRDLTFLHDAIQRQDGMRLMEIFSNAKSARDLHVVGK